MHCYDVSHARVRPSPSLRPRAHESGPQDRGVDGARGGVGVVAVVVGGAQLNELFNQPNSQFVDRYREVVSCSSLGPEAECVWLTSRYVLSL